MSDNESEKELLHEEGETQISKSVDFNSVLFAWRLKFKSLLTDLDLDQQSQLSKHLYSALMLRHSHHSIKYVWGTWPVVQAPKPLGITFENVDESDQSADEPMEQPPLKERPYPPGEKGTKHGTLQDRKLPTGSELAAARECLIQSMDSFVQKVVYKRIFADNLQPVSDPEPSLRGMGEYFVNKLESILHKMPSPTRRLNRYGYEVLDLQDDSEARDRLLRLLGPQPKQSKQWKQSYGRKKPSKVPKKRKSDDADFEQLPNKRGRGL